VLIYFLAPAILDPATGVYPSCKIIAAAGRSFRKENDGSDPRRMLKKKSMPNIYARRPRRFSLLG
jgi:hypothetical protein